MLRLYRRHLKACKFASKGRSHTKCGCPIWADGVLKGRPYRRTLDSLNWEHANRLLLEIVAGESRKECAIVPACEDFLRECRSRHLREATLHKYAQILNPLKKFCLGRAISTVRGLEDLGTIRRFFEEMTDAPLSKSKKIERMRVIFRFWKDMGWCDLNPALKLRKPPITTSPVLPFSAGQFEAILEAIDRYPTKNSFGYDNRARLRAFIFVLRYCAFRISDAVSLRTEAVKDGRVLLRTLKTGATVHLPLPPVALDALAKIKGGPYYFWSGNGKLKSAVADWQRSIRRLFTLAGVKGHPHQFRHTLAIELLEKGINVEHVAQILGNTPQIVFRHYAPWVPSRQKALDDAVMSVWG